MKNHDVQSVGLDISRSKAFAYIADPRRLPEWTHAFASARDGHAVLRTPNGEVAIGLTVTASIDLGTVDWRMKFPDVAGCVCEQPADDR